MEKGMSPLMIAMAIGKNKRIQKAVIDYLFTEIGVNRVAISHAVKNPASGRVAQKCGLTFEGIKREYFKTSTGEFLDISDYGIVRSEWENMRQENN